MPFRIPHFYDTEYFSYEGSWCPECLSGKPVPESEVCELVESQGFTLIGEFKGSNQKMVLLCPDQLQTHEVRVSRVQPS